MINNPVLWLELLTRLRERKLWIVSILFLVCISAIFTFCFLSVGQQFIDNNNVSDYQDPASLGEGLGVILSYFFLGLILVLSSLSGANCITQEREQRTLASLLNTPLPRIKIALGKLLGAWSFVLWLTSLSFPFFVTISLWGGIATSHLLFGFLVILLAGLTCASLGVGMSGLFTRTLNSYLMTGAAIFFWLVAWPIIGFSFLQLLNKQKEPSSFLVNLFFSHNPFATLTMSLWPDTMIFHEGSGVYLSIALSIWCGIIALSFFLAVRGLKRSLLERS